MNEHKKVQAVLTVGVAEAKARFSELLDRAASGDTIHITKHGKPIAELSPKRDRSFKKRKLPRVGAFAGEFELPDNWDDIPTGFEKYR